MERYENPATFRGGTNGVTIGENLLAKRRKKSDPRRIKRHNEKVRRERGALSIAYLWGGGWSKQEDFG